MFFVHHVLCILILIQAAGKKNLHKNYVLYYLNCFAVPVRLPVFHTAYEINWWKLAEI